MLFTKLRAYTPSQNNGESNHSTAAAQKPLMLFTSSRRHIVRIPTHVPKQVSVVHAVDYETQVAAIQEGKKVKWGEPFWNLFHVLAEKVKADEFPHIREGLLNLIYIICSNLPCPDCTQHAVHYLNGINFNAIQTKEQFRDMIYHFHNAVNVRKGYPIYPQHEVIPKYSRGRLKPIVEEFMKHFLAKSKSFRLLADEMQRKQISKTIHDWFYNNWVSFDA